MRQKTDAEECLLLLPSASAHSNLMATARRRSKESQKDAHNHNRHAASLSIVLSLGQVGRLVRDFCGSDRMGPDGPRPGGHARSIAHFCKLSVCTLFSDVHIDVVKDCVSAFFVHATFDHVYLDSRVCIVSPLSLELADGSTRVNPLTH